MKGDFSRDSFEPRKNFSRVLMQQGRVQVDADWNEHSAILLHYLRTLAADIIGRHAGPDGGFALSVSGNNKDLLITPGRYYVDGILCENVAEPGGEPVSYFNQPNYPLAENEFPAFPFLAYLDVWERHVTCLEDPELYEPALDGIDTTTRSQIVWQLKLIEGEPLNDQDDANALIDTIGKGNARLAARSDDPSADDGEPCVIDPDARYRGAENQLYRVEVHTGSKDQNGVLATPTFKWSRENGTVVFSVLSVETDANATDAVLSNLGRDDKSTLSEGDWVELVDDLYTLQNRADPLLKVISIDRDTGRMSLEGTTRISGDSADHPLLRRWDQKPKPPGSSGSTLILEGDKAARIVERTSENDWLTLEDGVQIQFLASEGPDPVDYRTGDYWLIPARVATGSIIWPKDTNGKARSQPPRGIEHHYAPLAIVTNIGGNPFIHLDCRHKLEPLTGV